MDDDRRAELLDRAYRRGSELRLRRRRWLATLAGLAVIAVCGSVAVGMSRTDAPKVSVGSTVPTASPRPPTEIVVLEAYSSRVAVISAANGKLIRVLAASRDLTRNDPTLAVTPDGKDVYFTTSRRPTPGECVGAVDEVVRVPVRGGPVSVIGPGVFPAVSPNGEFLAYVRNAASPCDSDHDELVVMDLQSGARRTYISPRRADLEFLSWAPDSVHLAYNDDAESSYTSPMLIDTVTARTLDDAGSIPHASNADWAGFLGDGGALGVTPHNGSDANPAAVVELDPTTGAMTRTLFTIPGGLAVANVLDGPEDTLHADRSGQDVLAIGLLPVNAQIRHGALYRWHDGDRKATFVADQIWAAAWVEPATVPIVTSP